MPYKPATDKAEIKYIKAGESLNLASRGTLIGNPGTGTISVCLAVTMTTTAVTEAANSKNLRAT